MFMDNYRNQRGSTNSIASNEVKTKYKFFLKLGKDFN